MCLIPDGDLFEAIRDGSAAVVTDTIRGFGAGAIELDSGAELPADVVVTATGLTLLDNFPMGGIELTVDGAPYRAADATFYRGCMLSDVPNLAFVMGYANASWTLKSDMVAEYVCRLLNRMGAARTAAVCPRMPPGGVPRDPGAKFFALDAGYLRRARDAMPRQGAAPWNLAQNSLGDWWDMTMLDTLGPELELSPPKARL